MKRALVTGGARGIGRAIAEELLRHGVAVVLADREGELARDTARALGSDGRACFAVEVDVTVTAQVDAALVRAEELLDGPVDILVNNAGVVVGGYFCDTTPEDTRHQLDVNLDAPLYLVHRLLPGMRQRGRGHLVQIASAAGLFPVPGIAVYAASKFALVGFSEVLRAELAGSGVGVSVICPGNVRTGIVKRSPMRNLPREQAERFHSFGVAPAKVGRAVVRAIRHDRGLVKVTGLARFGSWWYRHFPRTYRPIVGWLARVQRRRSLHPPT